mgnify:FL=1
MIRFAPYLAVALLLITSCKKDKEEEPQPQPTPTPQLGLVDVEGNAYDTVVIGGQTWMAENLRVRKYRNGDSIPYMPEATDWSLPGSNAYCLYGNALPTIIEHGFLYGYGAVNGARGICPQGWHVPTDTEWAQLELYLGMPISQLDSLAPGGYGAVRGSSQNVGGKLKDFATWADPNAGVTNSSGFSALASGQRAMPGSSYAGMGSIATFWTSTPAVFEGWIRQLRNDNTGVLRYHHDMGSDQPGYGHSCRCVKD